MKRGIIIISTIVAICAIGAVAILLCGDSSPLKVNASQKSTKQDAESAGEKISQINVNGLIWGKQYSIAKAKELLNCPEVKVSGPRDNDNTKPCCHFLYAGDDCIMLEDYIFRHARINSKSLWFGNPHIRVGADIKLLDKYLEGETIDVKQQAEDHIGFRYWSSGQSEQKDYAVKFFYNDKGEITKIMVSQNVVAAMTSTEIGVCSGNTILLLGHNYPSIESICRVMDAPLTRVREPQKGDEFPGYDLYFGDDHISWLEGIDEYFVAFITIKSPRYKVPNCFGVSVGDHVSKLVNLGGRLSDFKYRSGYKYVGAKSWRSSDISMWDCEICFQYDSEDIIREIHLSLRFI